MMKTSPLYDRSTEIWTAFSIIEDSLYGRGKGDEVSIIPMTQYADWHEPKFSS